VRQAASAVDLATLGRRQSALENSHSAIEAALLEIGRDLLSLRSARVSELAAGGWVA
jgi:hypothetical protein